MSMYCYKELLFQLPQKADEYRIDAYIKGTFYPENPNQEITPVVGRLVTLDGVEFPAFMSLNCWNKIQKRQDFTEHKDYYWLLYCQTKRNKEISEVQLLRPRIDLPYFVSFGGERFNPKIDFMRVRGQLKKIFKTSFAVNIQCQSHNEKDLLSEPFDIKIDGKLPGEAASEEFWEIICTRKGKMWRLKKAIKVDEDEFMEYKKNRRDILHNLMLGLDIETIPRYLIVKPNPNQFKENKQKKKAQPKASKKKKKPKPKPNKNRAAVEKPKITGRKFKLY